MVENSRDTIWTRTFALLCLAQVLGYAQHFLLMPAFPLYVTSLGGSPSTVGLVLASFAVTSVVIRPLMGYWADRFGEARVMVSGMLLQGISVPFCAIPLVEATIFANGLRGIGWAGLNAGGYSLLALTAPLSRRGEASGYYSGVQNSATIAFPALALWLIDHPFGGFHMVFIAATLLATLGAGLGFVLARYVPGSAPNPMPAASAFGWRAFFEFVERDLLLPAALHFCLQISIPSVTSFIVLFARESGLGSIASFYVVSGATSVLARPLLGRLSDKIGRGRSLAGAFGLQITALCLLVLASNLAALLLCGMLYVVAIAIGSSTTLALAMERANPQHRGRAMASFSIAYPLSYGVGGFLAGSAVDMVGYVWMYLMMAGLGVVGLFVTFANWRSLR
jgi:MFS family permease